MFQPPQVPRSADVVRVANLPWEPWWEAADLVAWTAWIQAQLSTHPTPCAGGHETRDGMCSKCGTPLRLSQMQAAALAPAYQGRGLFAPILAGGGKFCLDSELVATPDGWKSHGALRVGDLVIGSDGRPTEVLGCYPQPPKRVLRVEFSDGTSAETSEDHLWTFELRRGGRTKYTQPLYVWEKQKLSTPNKLTGGEAHVFFLPLIQPVQYAHQALPIEPYTLGALIGDGSLVHGQVTFTSMDADIVRRLDLPSECQIKDTGSENAGHARTYRITRAPGAGKANQMLDHIRDLGLDCKSECKFIPEIYKRGSIEQRLLLLQGLMDTDGTASIDRGSVSFGSSSERLARDVQELVESLGGTAHFGTKQTTHLLHFRLGIRLPSQFSPFLCRRKKGRPQTKQRKEPHRAVVAITDTGRVEGGQCIRVAAEDRLYAIRHYHLTHNTLISLLIPSAYALQHGPAPSLLMTPAALRDEAHAAMRRYARHWRLLPMRHLSYSELSAEKQEDILERWQPRIFICDEAHDLGNSQGPRWSRIQKYRKFCHERRVPQPIAHLMSGSFENRSRAEYWHLIRWALGGAQAPAAQNIFEFRNWCRALDSKVKSHERLAPGALLDLAPPAEGDHELGQLDLARARYGRRLTATRGVVASRDELPRIPIHARLWRHDPTPEQLEVSNLMRDTGETPCGIPLDEQPLVRASELWRHDREISCGFYQRWAPPPPPAWKHARRMLSICVRAVLDGRPHMTPAQAIAEIEAGQWPFQRELVSWRQIEPTYTYQTEPVWIADNTITLAADWLERERGLCWVSHIPFGERLSQMTGIPYFHEQGEASNGVKIDMWDGPAIASVKSCSRGFNLQGAPGKKAKHHKNLVVSSPTTNKDYEQLLARTHRRGSAADVIELVVMCSLEGDYAALAQAQEDAACVSRTKQSQQRLQIAKWG